MLVLLAGPAPAAPPDAADATAWVTDGPVNAIAHGAGRTFIGGSFTRIGPRTGPGMAIDAAGSAQRESFPEVAGGEVNAVVADGAGGWYIGGSFTHVGDVSRPRLAHIMAGGGLDPTYNPAPNGTVHALALGAGQRDSGVLYLGGEFTQVAGRSAANAAALTPSGTLVDDWRPNPDGAVHSLATTEIPLTQADGSTADVPLVFIGGAFAKSGSQSAPVSNWGVSPVWGAGSVDPESKSDAGVALKWAPLGATGTGAVRALAVSANDPGAADKASVAVYTGGDFTGSTLRAYQFQIAKAPLAGPPKKRADPAFSGNYANWSFAPSCPETPCTTTVRDIALDGERVLVAGEFLKLGSSLNAKRVAAVPAVKTPSAAPGTAPLTSASPWGAGDVSGPVFAVARSGGLLHIGGSFSAVGGRERGGLAALDADSGALSPDWNPAPAGGRISALAAAGSTIYAGGTFTALGTRPASRIAALDSTGAPLAGWSAGLDDGPVQALALSSDAATLYVGGGFTALNGGAATRRYAAALDAASGAVRDWNPDLDGWALALLPTSDAVYVGGRFGRAGGAARNNLAAVDPVTGAANGWNPDVNEAVRALAGACGTVYAGGSFTRVGGQPRNRIAAIDQGSGAPGAWSPDANSAVFALVADPGVLYAGGRFSLVGGALRDGLAALSYSTGKATGWNPSAGTAGSGIVNGLGVAPDGATVYAAGLFTRIGDDARSRVAAISAATGEATAWNPAADLRAYALAVAGDAVFVGGTFRQLGTRMQQGFGAYDGAKASGVSTPAGCPARAAVQEAPPAPSPGVTASGTPPPPPPPPALRIAAFKVKPPRFRPAPPPPRLESRINATATVARRNRKRPTSTRFLFTLNRAASVRFRISRELFGRRKGRSCVAPGKAPKGRRCTRYQLYRTMKRRGAAGANEVPFAGRFGRKVLPAGIYTVKLVARAGGTTRSRLGRFQVLGR